VRGTGGKAIDLPLKKLFAVKIIAKQLLEDLGGLQEFGMITIDNSGHPKVYFEDDRSAHWGGSLPANLVSNIPYSAFRVLDFSPQTCTPGGACTANGCAGTYDAQCQCADVPNDNCPPTCTVGDPCTLNGCAGTYNTACACVDTPNDNCPVQCTDNDRDGYGTPATAASCQATAPDCDDTNPLRHPGATETCGNGVDEDCDGTVDEGCACTSGQTRPCGSSTGECAEGTQPCAAGAWGACTGGIGPAPETCNNKDDDCIGKQARNDPGGFLGCSVFEGRKAKTLVGSRRN